jgi:hypothetical protein
MLVVTDMLVVLARYWWVLAVRGAAAVLCCSEPVRDTAAGAVNQPIQ